jgi:hypothetical protein
LSQTPNDSEKTEGKITARCDRMNKGQVGGSIASDAEKLAKPFAL